MTDVFVRPDVAAFLQFVNTQPGPKMHEVSTAEARMMMTLTGQFAELPIGDITTVKDISVPGPSGNIPVRVFDNRTERPAGPVMVFFHGGGFAIGDLDIYAPYCAEVARQLDIPVISVDYRLAPEHPFPAAAEDCEAAARWVAGSPAELGYAVTGLITSGDSAGGNLTIVTTMALRDNPAAVPVILQHPIYPVVSDHADWPSMAQFSDGYLLTGDGMAWFAQCNAAVTDDFRAAPLNFDQTGMPPSLVTTATLDPLHDQGIAYVEALRSAGVQVIHREADGNIHGHITLRKAIPSAIGDVAANLGLLQQMLNGAMAAA